MADGRHDELVGDLAALGRALDIPAPSLGMTTAVMERVAALPVPTPAAGWAVRWHAGVESRRRRVAVLVTVVLLGLLATPPVRAAVADFFGFGAVRVERGPAEPGTAPPPPGVGPGPSVAEAAAAVDFPLWLPAVLGDPDGVEVAPDLRRVSMSWTTEDGPVRLDQFGEQLDFSVIKRAPEVSYAAVGGADALWFDDPHEVVLIGPGGTRRTESARLAGRTLIWLDDATTLRLEGGWGRARAVEIAESSVRVG